ncbi:MAG: invasion protein CiaB [Arcobacteraceae bacterium]
MRNKFLEDVQKVYQNLTNRKEEVNKLYEFLENNEFDNLTIIDEFARKLSLEMSDDLRVALVSRLVSLRDDTFVQVLKKRELSESEIISLVELAYIFVSDFWNNYHNETLEFIHKENLLTPFYREIFKGVYNVGLKMTVWQSSWTSLIINGVNKELINKLKTDEKVMEFLEANNLFDLGHDELTADRSYSMLVKDENNEYKSEAYIKAFKKEVLAVIDALEELSDNLIELEDQVYDQKWQYIKYIQCLITAFSEKRTDRLVHYWSEVDRAWMDITSPIQIGHPLEYYEDHFRKAVALEWDIRLVNPAYQEENKRASKLKSMSHKIYKEIDKEENHKEIFDFCQKSIDKVQLYIGRPALFFGAEYNGLFSAQVVPNDEKISKACGKKIFAFSDEILQTTRAKPFLKLSREIFGDEFLKNERKFLFKNDKDWHKVYDITTIGHEFGHILWCDETTESIMNKSGNFKNIEEFKATTGGLVSFFLDDEHDEIALERFVISDTIKRAIGLIGWMEVDEVQPYYCEGLIHLTGLFQTGVLEFDKQASILKITTNESELSNLKTWYKNTYASLANHYLKKQDATIWLNNFATKENKYFLPNNENLKNFVLYYFDRYKKIGTEIDFTDKKENYLN